MTIANTIHTILRVLGSASINRKNNKTIKAATKIIITVTIKGGIGNFLLKLKQKNNMKRITVLTAVLLAMACSKEVSKPKPYLDRNTIQIVPDSLKGHHLLYWKR